MFNTKIKKKIAELMAENDNLKFKINEWKALAVQLMADLNENVEKENIKGGWIIANEEQCFKMLERIMAEKRKF